MSDLDWLMSDDAILFNARSDQDNQSVKSIQMDQPNE